MVLPHSHVDPGWLKTFENYYAQTTHSIRDNLVAKLTQHKNMTFIWTEIAFFAMWWDGALPTKKRQILKLVDEGRLEFTSGTWVMTDEATPHLYSMLDQMIEGKKYLEKKNKKKNTTDKENFQLSKRSPMAEIALGRVS